MPADDELDSFYIRDAVERIRSGDADARNELIRKAQNRLERLARKMLKGFPGVSRWEDTHDICQNATLRLLRALDTVKPDNRRQFFGLAAEQIRRELIDLARHYQGPLGLGANYESVVATTTRTDEGPYTHPLDAPDAAPSPNDLEHWRAFHVAVAQLPAKEREVLSLTFYHGWSQAQIGELLQVNERTVRRYYQSACQILRDTIGELPGEK